MILDYIRYSLKGILQRKTRSWLTMLGIFVGIAAVVSLISLSSGMQQAVNEQFSRLGAKRIVITPGQSSYGPMAAALTPAELTEEDLDVVEKVRGVDIAAGVLSESGNVEFANQKKATTIWGIPTEGRTTKYIEEISFLEVYDGRQFKPGESYAAILGYNAAKDLFRKELKVNDMIVIEGYEFTVIGLQKKAGNGMYDQLIRIPLSTARKIFGEEEKVTSIFARVKDEKDIDIVAEGIKKELRKFRNVKAGEEDFSVQTAQQLIGTFKNILLMVQVVLTGIAAISLIVGGIGIMNTMYTAVLERKREIGVMKSVGARNRDVLLIFLFESGILGMAGGLIGVILGLLISNTAAFIVTATGVAKLSASNSPLLITGALLFSFTIGSLSGIMPAVQAAGLKPVEALKK